MPKYENKIVKINNQVCQEKSKKDQECNRAKDNIDKKNIDISQEDDFDFFGVSLD